MEVHTRGSKPQGNRIKSPKIITSDYAESNKENVGPQLQLRGGGTPGSASKKRRHQERDSALQDDYEVDNGILAEQNNSTPKRPRTAEWPLKNGVDINVGTTQPSMKKPLPSEKRRSPELAKKRARSGRKSAFKEGSLNDKPSKRPPTEIVGEEVEGFTTVDSGNTGKGPESNDLQDVKDTAKSGGIFRFGKTLASALNPANLWQGIWKEKEPSYTDLKPAAQEQARKEEIDKAYNKLRDSGYKGVKVVVPPPSVVVSQKPSPDESAKKRNSFRDSGISMGESSARSSEEGTKLGSKYLQIPTQAQRASSTSPPPAPSSVASSRRSFSQLRSTSSTNLRKVRSHINMPSPRKRAASIKNIPSIDSVLAKDAAISRMPPLPQKASKKDLAKACRLDKKVSDLEGRLEAARAERTALNTIPIPDTSKATRGRKPFVPGALDSLPSERLLTARVVRSEHDIIVETVPKEKPAKNVDKSLPPTPDQKVGSWLNLTPRKRDTGNTPLKPGRGVLSGKKGTSKQHLAEQHTAVPGSLKQPARRRSGRLDEKRSAESLRRSTRRRSSKFEEKSSAEPASEQMESGQIRRSGKGWVEYFDAEPAAEPASLPKMTNRKGNPISAPTPRNSPLQRKLQENQRAANKTSGPKDIFTAGKCPPLGVFPGPTPREVLQSRIRNATVPPPRKPGPDSNFDTISDPNLSKSTTNSAKSTSLKSAGPASDISKNVIIEHNGRVRKPVPNERKALAPAQSKKTPSTPTVSELTELPSTSSEDSDSAQKAEYMQNMLQHHQYARNLRAARREKATDNFGNDGDDEDDDGGAAKSRANTTAATMHSSTTTTTAAEGDQGPGPATKAVRRLTRKSTSRDLRKRKSACGGQGLDEEGSAKKKAKKCGHGEMEVEKEVPDSQPVEVGAGAGDGDIEMGEAQDTGKAGNAEPYVWEDEDVF